MSTEEDEIVCSICCDPLSDGKIGIMKKGKYRVCSHFLHFSCAKELMEKLSATCPVCREPFIYIDEAPDFDLNQVEFYRMLDYHGVGYLKKRQIEEIITIYLNVHNVSSIIHEHWKSWTEGEGLLTPDHLNNVLKYLRHSLSRSSPLSSKKIPKFNSLEMITWFRYYDTNPGKEVSSLTLTQTVYGLMESLQLEERLDENMLKVFKKSMVDVWEMFCGDVTTRCTMQNFFSDKGIAHVLLSCFGNSKETINPLTVKKLNTLLDRYLKLTSDVVSFGDTEDGKRGIIQFGTDVKIKKVIYPVPKVVQDRNGIIVGYAPESSEYLCFCQDYHFYIHRSCFQQIVPNVVITGMSSKNFFLNGQVGTLYDREFNRYFIKLSNGKELSVKKNRLVFPPGVRIEMVMPTIPELHGKFGVIVSADIDKNRYVIGFDSEIFSQLLGDVEPEMFIV